MPTLDGLVWRALAHPTRRGILDALAAGPLATGAVCDLFPPLCRTNVMKHMDVLEAADLLMVRRVGRRRMNYLNPVPIQRIHDRWLARHVRGTASALARLKQRVEANESERRPRRPTAEGAHR